MHLALKFQKLLLHTYQIGKWLDKHTHSYLLTEFGVHCSRCWACLHLQLCKLGLSGETVELLVYLGEQWLSVPSQELRAPENTHLAADDSGV